MKKKAMGIGVWVWTLVLVSTSGAQAQIAEDMIFHNGKIVTVDGHGFNSQVGTIVPSPKQCRFRTGKSSSWEPAPRF